MNSQDQHKPYVKRSFANRLRNGLVGLALTTIVLSSCGDGNRAIKIHLNPKSGRENPLAQQMAIGELLTYQIYDSKFRSIKNSDEIIATELYRYDLEDLVNMKALSSKNKFQKDLWLPIGLKGDSVINFYKGMSDSWDDKLQRYSSDLKYQQKNILINEKNESLQKIKRGLTKSNLRKYRGNEIAKGIELLDTLSKSYLAKNYTDSTSVREVELRRLVLNVENNLSANVLLGYNIQELLPPSFEKNKINAAAKAYFLDQYLLGGKEVLERFPARYDIMLSYGPFQLTKWAMAEIDVTHIDKYLPAQYHSPKTMTELRSLQDNVNAAVKFAFINWLRLGETLANNGKLQKFNDGFEKLDEREQKILLAGMTACMHHMPEDTRVGVINYLDRRSMRNMHYKLCDSFSTQLSKYYRSSAEAYLFMKVYDVLDEKYSK